MSQAYSEVDEESEFPSRTISAPPTLTSENLFAFSVLFN